MSLITTPTIAAAIVAALLATAAIIWFLRRKRRKLLWMPVLRVISIETKKLPTLIWTPPPWLAFICFLLTALCLAFFSLQPRENRFSQFDPDRSHIHVFFDMSPSILTQIESEQYFKGSDALFKRFSDGSKVTFSTTHDSDIYDFESVNEANEKLRELGFHRPGSKLGETINAQSAGFSGAQLLLIVSDGDKFSWADFNWKYLKDRVTIRHIAIEDLATANPIKTANVYIAESTSLATEGNVVTWEVTIARSGELQELSGKLIASIGSQQLYAGNWRLAANSNRVKIVARWASDAHLANSTETTDADQAIQWNLAPDSASLNDLDNTYYTSTKQLKRKVLLVGDHFGEQPLLDHASQLTIALETQGYLVHRLDRVSEFEKYDEYDFWIILAGSDLSLTNQCPTPEKIATLGPLSSRGRAWLAPIHSRPSWEKLCRCFRRMRGEQVNTNQGRDYCRGVQTDDQFAGVLKSVGAKQVGGELGKVAETLAWHMNDGEAPRELLIFTVPLRSTLAGGLGYAALPLLTQGILDWQNQTLVGINQDNKDWPTLSSMLQLKERGLPASETLKWARLSNIPAGESQMTFLESKNLPKRWNPLDSQSIQLTSATKNNLDPMPWLRLIVFIIAVTFLIEGVLVIASKILKRRLSTGLIIVASIWGASSEPLSANVQINAVGYPDMVTNVKRLSREVQGRTSIQLESNSLLRRDLDNEHLKEPWIWIESPLQLHGIKDEDRNRLLLWIKRGGFLIIENVKDLSTLQRFTESNLLPLSSDPGWQGIPPNHEIMRSFHLLESLPVCGEQLWHGFHFDARLAILAIPGQLISSLADKSSVNYCDKPQDREKLTRIFINILMVALATDYKKDQIHLPEILKRLR